MLSVLASPAAAVTSFATQLQLPPAHLPLALAAAGPWNGHGPGWWILLIPLFWILVLIAVIVLVRRFAWRNREHVHGAEGVLRERYARGEIDESEFRQRMEVLRGVPRK